MALPKQHLQTAKGDEAKRSAITAMFQYGKNDRFSTEYYGKLMTPPTEKSNAQQNVFSTPPEVYWNNYAKYLQLWSQSWEKKVPHFVNFAPRVFHIHFSQTMNLLYASVH